MISVKQRLTGKLNTIILFAYQPKRVKQMPKNDPLTQTDILALDYDGKIKLLEMIAQEVLGYQVEFAEISGRHAEIKANLAILKLVTGSLQSAIKAERAM